MLNKRLEYIRTCFERCYDIKQQKIQELIKTIPNSLKEKDTVKITPLEGLSERYNPGKMLSAKIISKLTMDKDIPEYFICYRLKVVFGD